MQHLSSMMRLAVAAAVGVMPAFEVASVKPAPDGLSMANSAITRKWSGAILQSEGWI